MIDFDNPTVAAFGVILISLIGPVMYAFWIDKWKKDTPDPRHRKF